MAGQKEIFAANIFKAGIFKAGIIGGGGLSQGCNIKNNPGFPCCDEDETCIIHNHSLRDYDESTEEFKWNVIDPPNVNWESDGVHLDTHNAWVFSSVEHPDPPYASRVRISASCELGCVIELYLAATVAENGGISFTDAVMIQAKVNQDCLELKILTRVDSVDIVMDGPWYWRHGGVNLGVGFSSNFSIDAVYDNGTGEVYVDVKKTITPDSPQSQPPQEEQVFSKWLVIDGFTAGDRVGFGTDTAHIGTAKFTDFLWDYLYYEKGDDEYDPTILWCPSPVTCVLIDENFATWPTPICDWTEVVGTDIGILDTTTHTLTGTGNALVVHNNELLSDWEDFFTVACDFGFPTLADNQTMGVVFWSNAAGTSYYVAEFDYGVGVDQYGATAGVSRIRKVDGGSSVILAESQSILFPQNNLGICISTTSTKITAQLPGGNLSYEMSSEDRFGDYVGFMLGDMGSNNWIVSDFISKKRGPLYNRDGTVSVNNCSDCGGGYACGLCEDGTPDEYLAVFNGVNSGECLLCGDILNRTVIFAMEPGCQTPWLNFDMEDCSKIIQNPEYPSKYNYLPHVYAARYDFRFISIDASTFKIYMGIDIFRAWGGEYNPWQTEPPPISLSRDMEIHQFEVTLEIPYDCHGIYHLRLPFKQSIINPLYGYGDPEQDEYFLCDLSNTDLYINAI